MSDVVVIYPKTGLDRKGVSITLPLSILSASSGLIGEFNVTVIDQRVNENWKKELEEELISKPLCVALSSMTGTQIFYALEVSRFVKENYPEIPVVWGGMHVTLLAEQSLKHPYIDFIIKGEGEIAFRDFVRKLADKRHFETVAGLGWKNPDGSLIINPEEPPLDLNNLPPIPYHLINIEDYIAPTQYMYPGVKRLLPFQGSRGCPFKCAFCSEPALTKIYRMMKPELFYEETMKLVRCFNLNHIVFYDEEFFANARWAAKIAELINGQYTWNIQSRANDMLKVDLKKMERCGMLVVAPGLESGSNRVLKWIKKLETTSQYLEANRRLAETSVFLQYNFMMGFPGETKEELTETVDLALQLMKDNPRAVVNQFSPFTPLPGTELLNISVKEFGFKMPRTLESWIGISRRRFPTPWMQKNLEFFQALMYSSFFVSIGKHNPADRFAKTPWYAPSFLFNLYARLIKRRWKKHNFKITWDIKWLRRNHRRVAPIDFVKTFEANPD